MENDSIRTAGELTLVDVWIDGKLRSVSVARDAIAKLLQLAPERAATMSDDECREFVRTRLALVAAAARDRLKASDPSAEAVTLTAGNVGAGAGETKLAERRQGERRKRERRAPGQAVGRIGDRRQGDRRKGGRRKAANPPPDDGGKS